MKARLKSNYSRWQRFWFESKGLSQMVLFRKTFGLMLFVFYLIRSFDLELFFSEKGLMPLASVDAVLPMAFRQSIFFYLTATPWLWVFNVIFLASLLTMAFGFYPRLSALVAFILHISFLHRDMAPTYGVDMISSFFLLYLCFADSKKNTTLGSMVYRLSQLQVCIIYAYSGLDKARGVQWWGGEALWGVIANAQLVTFDLSAVASFPLVVVAATYMTLAWEIYFPVLVWIKPVRKWVLWFGVLLHAGIAFVVNIPFFGLLMVLSYILFLEPQTAAFIERRVRFRTSS